MKDKNQRVSIEYSHIYVDEEFSEEHQISLNLLKKKTQELKGEYDQIDRIVMIDNYSPDENTLDVNNFLSILKEKDASPDYVVYEGDLDQMAVMFLKMVKNNRLRNSYTKYIEKRNGYVPCSLFIATWYMTRLGYLHDNKIRIPKVDKTISILSDRFKSVEKKGLELIAKSEYPEAVNRIEQIFFNEPVPGKYQPKF